MKGEAVRGQIHLYKQKSALAKGKKIKLGCTECNGTFIALSGSE